MTRTTAGLLFAGVLLGAGVTIAAWRSETRAPRSQSSVAVAPDRRGEDVANLSARIEWLERRLASMKQQQSAQPNNQPPPANPGPETPAPPGQDETRPTREQAEAQFKEYVAEVGRSFEQEKSDPAWTKQTSPQIAAAFSADTVLQNTAADIECREHTCRVQIEDTDRQVSPRMASIARQLGKTVPYIIADRVDQGNGRSVMVLYMTTKPFPQVSPGAR